MSYLVFARKFRPRTFSEVSGQETVVRTLENAIRSERIAHAFVFSGPRGVGKTTMARLLAKALNCINGPTPEPCLKCDPCTEIAEGRDMDVLEIDGASNRGIDEVKQIRENVRYTPSRDRFKLFIIDEVHMLTQPAFNALLKTLEEPPAHVKFIFATTELHAIPATVRSRCQQHEFRRVPFKAIVERLQSIAKAEKLKVEEAAAVRLARAADGSLRDALGGLDQVVAFAGKKITAAHVAEVLGLIDRNLVLETADAVLAADAEGVIRSVDRLMDAGYDLRAFSAELTEHFRNLVVHKTVPEPGELLRLGEKEKERLAEQTSDCDEDHLLRLLNSVSAAEQELTRSNQPRFTLERILLRMVSLGRLRPLEEILAELRGGAPPSPDPPPPPAAKKRRPTKAAEPRESKAPAGSAQQNAEARRQPEPEPIRDDAQAAAPAQPAETGDLRRALAEGVKKKKRSVGAYIDRAQAVRLEADTLTLIFSLEDRFFRSSLEDDENRRLLEQVLAELKGPGLKLCFEDGNGPGSQARAVDKREALKKKVLQDTLVQDFLEVFEGEIIDCEES